MASNIVHLDSKELKKAIDGGMKLGPVAIARLRVHMRDTVLKTERRAKELAPIDEGHLRRGIIGRVNVAGPLGLVGSITAGGLAAAYAEVQHERDDFTHTLAEWAMKYGFAAASSVKTRKAFVIGKRVRRLKVRGHKGGQAHFIYGAGNSAWSPSQQSKHRAEVDTILGIVGEEAFE